MIGLLIALIYVAILAASHNNLPEIHQKTTKFLFYWYSAFAFLGLLFWLGVVVIGSFFVNLLFGPLVAFLGGSVSALAVITIVVVLSFFQVLGAHFASTAVTKNGDIYNWRAPRLFIGWLFIFIGIWNFLS